MAAWDLDDQIDPLVPLSRSARGSVCLILVGKMGSSIFGTMSPLPILSPRCYGLADHVKRRIWSAQAAVVLPFADRIRRGLIGRHRAVLDRRVSAEHPYVPG